MFENRILIFLIVYCLTIKITIDMKIPSGVNITFTRFQVLRYQTVTTSDLKQQSPRRGMQLSVRCSPGIVSLPAPQNKLGSTHVTFPSVIVQEAGRSKPGDDGLHLSQKLLSGRLCPLSTF